MRIILLSLIFTLCIANEKIFIACEGNFYQSNGSIWAIDDSQVSEYEDYLGEIVQSLYVHNDKLFVIINGSSNIQVFDILEQGLIQTHFVDTQSSGPREMIVHDNFLYFTNWYSADVKKLNLITMEIESSIAMPGLPEDIVFHDNLLYVSITMDFDWTDGDKVVSINPENDSIVNIYDVGSGPGDLLVHNNAIYVSRTSYDENWNAFYGTSKIDENDNLIIVEYGTGTACGGSVMSYQDDVYRIYDGGIAKLDNNLNILPETRIGNFNIYELYAAEVINDYIYFGLSDYQAPDEVVVLDSQGNEINRYNVGAIPTDFVIWESCDNNGDINLSMKDIK